MSEKEFKNNRPKSDEKDLEGLVQNFSQKVEPATKKLKKQLGKLGARECMQLNIIRETIIQCVELWFWLHAVWQSTMPLKSICALRIA